MPIPSPSSDSYAIVTGASQGIGRALAVELAEKHYNLILIARRKEILTELAASLEQLHKIKCLVRAVDLADPVQRTPLITEIKELKIDILCNNAGIATFGALLEQDPEFEKSQVQLDVNAAFELMLAVLPGMKARKAGGILVSGSAAGNMPIPFNATYSASKAFINTFTEALHTEMKPFGVHLTLLAPGPVRPENPAPEEESFIDKSVPNFLWMPSVQVAKLSLDALQKNKLRIVPGVLSKGMSVLGNYSPRFLSAATTSKFFKKMSDKQ